MSQIRLTLRSQKSGQPDVAISLAEGQGWVVIGAGASCGARVAGPNVGDKHCQVMVEGGHVKIQTLDFGTGTWINDAPIDAAVELHEGDSVGIGDMVFKAAIEPVGDAAAPAAVAPAAAVESHAVEPPSDTRAAAHAPAAPAVPLTPRPSLYQRSPLVRGPGLSRGQPGASGSRGTSGSRGAAPGAHSPVSPPPAAVATPVAPAPVSPATESPVAPAPVASPAVFEVPSTPLAGGSVMNPDVAAMVRAWPQYAARHDPAVLDLMMLRGREQASKLGFVTETDIGQFLECILLCNDDLVGPNSVSMDVWYTLTTQGKPAPMRLKRALTLSQRIAETRYKLGAAVSPPRPAPVASPAASPAIPAAGIASPAAAATGELVIDGFTIMEKVAEGGMGEVYRARDNVLDVDVAVKLVRELKPEATERFLSEARAAAKVQHPNIVQVLRYGHAPQGCYYVMQFIKGMDGEQLAAAFKSNEAATKSAGEVLKIAGTDSGSFLPELQPAMAHPQPYYAIIATWIAMVADGLERAHAAGVVHRDIKPGNLMLAPDGRMMLADFGLAVRADQRYLAGCVGTPRYLSPEMLACWAGCSTASGLDERLDIWGLGLTLLELLVLRPIYDGPMERVLRDIATIDPPLARQLNSSIPPTLEAICAKAVERNPSQRYAHAADMAAELRMFVSIVTPPAPAAETENGKATGIFGWLRKKP